MQAIDSLTLFLQPPFFPSSTRSFDRCLLSLRSLVVFPPDLNQPTLHHQPNLTRCMSRRSIENVRLIYWEALSKMPIIKWVFFLCGGIPIKILGGTSLQEGENKYCKESGACECMCGSDGRVLTALLQFIRSPQPPFPFLPFLTPSIHHTTNSQERLLRRRRRRPLAKPLHRPLLRRPPQPNSANFVENPAGHVEVFAEVRRSRSVRRCCIGVYTHVRSHAHTRQL